MEEQSSDKLVREPASQMEWFFAAQTDTKPVMPSPDPIKENTSNLPLDQIICTDNLKAIRALPNGSIDLIVTSPPYFQQRDYGYDYGAAGIGSEPSLQEYLDRLLCLFRECVRVTTNDGSIVFNLGDKYQEGNLLLVPYRFAIAATETGLVKAVLPLCQIGQLLLRH